MIWIDQRLLWSFFSFYPERHQASWIYHHPPCLSIFIVYCTLFRCKFKQKVLEKRGGPGTSLTLVLPTSYFVPSLIGGHSHRWFTNPRIGHREGLAPYSTLDYHPVVWSNSSTEGKQHHWVSTSTFALSVLKIPDHYNYWADQPLN